MITAADLMTRDVLTVTPDASVADVADMILKHRLSALPVIDADRHLLGIVSEGDLIRSTKANQRAHRSSWLVLLTNPRAEANGIFGKKDCTVDNVMSRDVLMASEGESLARLIDLLSTSRIKRLPIVGDGKLVGIVSRIDVLRYLASTFSRTGRLVA